MATEKKTTAKTTAKAETKATAKTETKTAAKAETKTTAAKTTAKKAETKTAAKTTTAKKTTTTKKTTTKKTAAKVELFIEYAGVQVAVDEIIENVKKVNGKDAKSYTIYVKPEESKAYFVADGEEKDMDVYFA
ncbi:MAG: hypothetical protein IJV88_02985 [Ruminococcus sp.]|nr:hypothetical protein [Ruminococcus sp.]